VSELKGKKRKEQRTKEAAAIRTVSAPTQLSGVQVYRKGQEEDEFMLLSAKKKAEKEEQRLALLQQQEQAKAKQQQKAAKKNKKKAQKQNLSAAQGGSLYIPGRNLCDCQGILFFCFPASFEASALSFLSFLSLMSLLKQSGSFLFFFLFLLARRHALLGNCLNCGKVVCKQEGEGPCLFCSIDSVSYARQPEDYTEEELLANPDLIQALQHKDKLLEYDQQSAKRTAVYGLFLVSFFLMLLQLPFFS
jgi:hypothetical protein